MSREMLAVWFRKAAFCLSFSLLLTSIVNGQAAERPSSEELLPETTVAYIQMHNVRDFVEKLKDTNGARLVADERIAPLVNDLYKTAQDAYSDVEEVVGLSLEELQSLPAGEICFAMIAPRRKSPAFVFIIDTDEDSEAVEKALQRGRDLAAENEVELESEETDDVTYEKFNVNGNAFWFFRKEGTLVVGSDKDELDAIVDRWMNREVEKIRPLKENRKFITIMNRCRGTKEIPNDMRFFVDPIALAKSATRGNVAAQTGLNFLPILGLDGFSGAGGSMIVDEMDFESVMHAHVLLANPRAGIFEMLALKPGKYEPQPWVPENVIAYLSTSWDIQKAFDEFEKIYDSFSGEGALAEEIEDEINAELDIDFKSDFIDQLSGRATYIQWVGDQIAINAQINAVGVGLKDTDEFMKIVDLFLEKVRDEDGEDAIEEVDHKGVTFWQSPNEKAEEQRERLKEEGPQLSMIRVPQPCFAILDDHLVISDSPDFIKRAIETSRGKEPCLYDDEKFQYVSREMNRLLGTDLPGAVMFNRPSESMRMMFEVAEHDDARNFLDEMAEENKYAQGVRDAMSDNPLPDFDEIKDYFPPSGAFVTNDDTGYHFLIFQLKSSASEGK